MAYIVAGYENTPIVFLYQGDDTLEGRLTAAFIVFQKANAIDPKQTMKIVEFLSTHPDESKIYGFLRREVPSFVWTEMPEL